VKLQRLLFIGLLVVFGSSRPAIAQSGLAPETMLLYVSPTLNERILLSPSEHVLKFSMPVQIPGAALAAGRYIFRVVAPSLVQVVGLNRSRIYATLLTIPAWGSGDTSRERMKFELNPEEEIPRLVGWYLPESIGHEFLYPKSKRVPAER